MVSMQSSGTHWLKHLLTHALAIKYNVPPPEYVQNALSNAIIGHPKHIRMYSDLPRIASSHSIPHALLGMPLLHRFLHFPRYVVLVRDIRASLVSHYEKRSKDYDVSFSEYLRGDPAGRRFHVDIWWFMHFMNRWGSVNETLGDKVLVVKYEELRQNTQMEVRSVFEHFGIDMPDAVIAQAVAESTKEKMIKKVKEDHWQQGVIRIDSRDPLEWYTNDDKEFFMKTIKDNAQHTFGYNYWAK